jgi:DNA-binding PucR family transcriptional regulator
MLVAELSGIEVLGLTLVAPGTMDRTIRSVYTTDLPSPGAFLEGGEFVLTSATWYRDAIDAETFVRDLSQAKTAALAVGTAGVGAVPDPLREACIRHGMPLFVVADDVSFATITETIAGLLSGPGGRSPAAGLHRRLLVSLASGAGAEELVILLGRATGVGCALLSSTGRLLTAELPGVSSDDLRHAFRTGLARGAMAAVHRTPGSQSQPLTFFPIQSPIAQRPPAAYLVLSGQSSDWAPRVADAALEVCALIAIEKVNRMEGRRIESRLLRDAFDLARAGSTAEADLRLDALGINLSTTYVAATASSRSTRYGRELAATLLEDLAGEIPGCTPALNLDGNYLMLIPAGTEQEASQHLSRAAQRLAPLIAPGWIALGTSTRVHGLSALRVALDQTHHAHRIACDLPGQFRLATSRDLSSHLLLLASVPDEVKALFRSRVIGALEEYDAHHQTNLLETLTAFLEESGSWTRTANQLHIHVNTLRYRLQRVEEISGHGLSTLEDRIDFRLALNMRPMTADD